MSAPTPGPWNVVTYRSGTEVTVATVEGLRVVFNDARGTRPLGTPEADARLIAASPDLLAACKAALECCGSADHWNGKTREFLLMMQAAVDKAEGRS